MNAGRRLRLGILTLIAGAAFAGLLGFVLQGALRDDTVRYYILFAENVKGMVVGSKVNFQGVPLGMVSDIRFQNGRTLVELSVDPTKAVIQDITRARLDRLLVTGQVTVELEGYGPEGTELQPGQFIEPTHDPLNRLTKTLPDVVPQMTGLMQKLEDVLDLGLLVLDEPNRGHIAAILRNTSAATEGLPATMARVDGLMTRAEAAVATLERAAGAVADDLAPAGVELAAESRQLVAELRALQAVFGETATQAQALVSGLRGPALTALASLRGSLDELRGFARQLRLAPDSLLFGVTRPAGPIGGGR